MIDNYKCSFNEHLYQNRIVYLSGDITTDTANQVVSKLLVLDSIDHETEIKVYISSHGGNVYAGLAIYDAMQLVKAPVSTFCIGPAFSMAAWLLAAGTKGRRLATPNSRIMLHQSRVTEMNGKSSDIQIVAENLLKTERLLNEILAAHTGRSFVEVAKATHEDLWLSAEEARTFGIIDAVAASKSPGRSSQTTMESR